jgi:hypothetical protein
VYYLLGHMQFVCFRVTSVAIMHCNIHELRRLDGMWRLCGKLGMQDSCQPVKLIV